VIGIVAMLVQATGAPAFSAACSGGSAGSQCIPRKRRAVTFPTASETSRTRGCHDLRLGQLAPIKAGQQLDRDLRCIEFFSEIKPESASS
jgi:hypothetical protein